MTHLIFPPCSDEAYAQKRLFIISEPIWVSELQSASSSYEREREREGGCPQAHVICCNLLSWELSMNWSSPLEWSVETLLLNREEITEEGAIEALLGRDQGRGKMIG